MKVEHESMLDFIVKYIKEKGYSPTTREICRGTGYQSTSSVNIHLKAMRDVGLINYVDGSPRTITVAGYQYIKQEAVQAKKGWRICG